VKFTIRADKCPNRRGVEEILRHFHGEIVLFDQVIEAAGRGELQAVYLAAGYPPRQSGWINQQQATALARAGLLIVQDIWPSPVSALATHLLPGVTFAEKEGTFVNHAGLAQALHWTIAPPIDARPDGQIFLDLLQRRGLIHAPTLRKELADEVKFFTPLAYGPGNQGVLLKGGD
jgi:NADH-quinone oxidoreductase subunit G